MSSPVDINNLQADDNADLRVFNKQFTLAGEAARAEYIAEQFGDFGQRLTDVFRRMTEVFSFAQQANQAARL